MSLFDVIFNRHEKFSSDANVNASHDGSSIVSGPLHQADVARVEADSPEAAKAAVAVAYAASTSEVTVHEVPKETVKDEKEQTPTAEANASDRSVLANQPYIVPDEYSDKARKPAESADSDKYTLDVNEVKDEPEPVSEKSALSVNEVKDEPVNESAEPEQHVDAPVQVDAPTE